LSIDAPFQVSLCNEDGTVIEENIKLRNLEEARAQMKPANQWPFDNKDVE
jgi:hypothetical protein